MFTIFRDFFIVCASFSKFRTCSDPLGPIGTHSEASGGIRMHLEAVGRQKKRFDIVFSFFVRLFSIVFDIFRLLIRFVRFVFCSFFARDGTYIHTYVRTSPYKNDHSHVERTTLHCIAEVIMFLLIF